MDNRTLLAKADLALSDLVSNGGILQPEQAKKFIKLLIKEAVLMKLCTVVPMKNYKKLMEKIVLGERIMRAGFVGTALPSADRASPTTSKVELDVKLFKAQVNLSDETLEDNIEEGALKDTILQLMAERVSVDTDEILVSGDIASADTFLAQFDGILKAATSNIVDATGGTLDKNVLRDMLKMMPKQYLRAKNKLQYLTSVNAEIDYRDSISERETVLGDTHTTQDVPATYSSRPVRAIPMFPEDLGATTNLTNAILCDPKNILLGIFRDVRFEWDKDIEAGVTKIVVTTRMDAKYLEETAVVKAINILAE